MRTERRILYMSKTVKFNDFFKRNFCLDDYSSVKNIELISPFFPKGIRGKNSFKKIFIEGCDNDTADVNSIVVGENIYANIRKGNLKIWSPYQIEFDDETIGMFYQMMRIEEVIMNDAIVFNLTSFMDTFSNCKRLKYVEMHADCAKVNSFQRMFFNSNSLKKVVLDFKNTGNVRDMSLMFKECFGLKYIIGIETWDASHVTKADEMFKECTSLKSIPIQDWKTSSLRSMRYIFSSCYRLEENPIEKWNTSSLVDASGVFELCTSLTSINLSGWNTERLETAADMFDSCSFLRYVNLDNWDGFNIINIDFMFRHCTQLEDVSMKNWKNKASVERAEGAFMSCEKLTVLDLSNVSFERCKNMANMFTYCKNLVWIENDWNIYPGIELSVSMFYDCASLVLPDTSSWPCHNMFDASFYI